MRLALRTHGLTALPLCQPGHALVITQWKPELALSTDPTLINLTVPDAIPTIKSIWKGACCTISMRPRPLNALRYRVL